MEQPLTTGRPPLARAVLLAGIMAAAVLALRLGAGRLRDTFEANSGELHRRAGDTFVSLSYLVSGENSNWFLTSALGEYRAGIEADPNDFRATVSQALVRRALHHDQEARDVLQGALKHAPTEAARSEARLLLAGALADPPDPAQVDPAYAVARDLAPAPLVFFEAYLAIGRKDTARQVYEAGFDRARQLLPGAIAMLAVCVLIVLAGGVGLIAFLLGPNPRRWLPGGTGPSQGWSLRDAAEAVALFLVLQVLLGVLFAQLSPRPGLLLYQVLAAGALAGVGAVAWVKGWAGRATWLGWRTDRPARQMLLGLAAGGAIVLPAQGLAWLVETLFHLPGQQAVVSIFPLASTLPARLFLILGVCAIMPALEETVFRGLLYGALRRQAAPRVAALISAVIFAGAHWAPAEFLSLALVGLVLAWLYERSGSLLVPAAAHGAFNAFSVAIMLLIYR